MSVTDHGRRVHVAPALQCAPASVEQVRASFDACRAAGHAAALRGHGCSSNGLSLSPGAIIDCRALDAIAFDAERGLLLAGGGAPISAIIDALAVHGCSLAVLPSNPGATLGGVLSAGGIGQTSIVAGPLAQYVAGLTLVTPDQGVLEIDFDAQPQWRAIVGCFGALGVIAEVRLKVRRGRPGYLVETLAIAGVGFDAALAQLRAGGPDYLLALYDPWKDAWRAEKGYLQGGQGAPVADIHRHVQEKEIAFLKRRAALFDARPPERALCNIWADFFIPIGHAAAFRQTIVDAGPGHMLLPGINIGIVEAGAAEAMLRFPLLPVGAPGVFVSFGLYAAVEVRHAESVAALFDALRERCLALGGRQYLHGAFPPTRAFLERQFGAEAVAQLALLKARVDALNLLGGLPLRGAS
jgi:cytokinin dehydrogenase